MWSVLVLVDEGVVDGRVRSGGCYTTMHAHGKIVGSGAAGDAPTLGRSVILLRKMDWSKVEYGDRCVC